MTHFGRYETVEELYRGPLGHVAVARLLGDDEGDEFVIKSFDPALMGLLEADAATQTFLDRAGLQKLLADRGCPHWSPIYEMKATAEGAYYVTDYYPLTAQKLLEAGANLAGADLHWLVRSLVQGLLELKAARKRAHGNLKPGNVLIASRGARGGQGGLGGANVFLADPGSGGRGADERVSDLRAIGKLIHHLVLHQPFRGEQDWPVPDGPAWGRLGREGRGWRDLCRQLLDSSARPEDVESLAIAVEGLAPKPPAKRRHLLALAALPVLALLIGMGFWASVNRSAHDELASVDRAWFSQFAKGMEDRSRRDRFRTDPDLALVVEELVVAEARHLPLDADPPGGFQLAGAAQTHQILDAIKRITTDLSPQQWRHLSEAEALRRRYEEWGWKQPSDYLAKLIAGARPGPGHDVADGIDRFVTAQPRLSADADAARELYKPFDADLKSVEQTKDHTLVSFAAALRRSALEPLRLGDGGLEGLDVLKSDAKLARQLAAIAHGGWPRNYGVGRLSTEVEAHLNMADPGAEDVRQWVAAAPDYALVPLDDASEAVASLRRSFAKVKEDLAKQTFDAIERKDVERAEAEVELRIKNFSRDKYLLRDQAKNGGELAANRDLVQGEIESLRKTYVHLDDPREWIAFVDQPLPATSERLKQRWKSWVDAQRARSAVLADDHDAFVAAKKAAEQVKAALASLDQKFPPLPLGLSEKFAAAAWDKREQDLADLTAWAAPGAIRTPATTGSAGGPTTVPTTGFASGPTTGPAVGPPTPPDNATVIAARAAQFSEWVTNLRELGKDFPVTRELLTLEDRPDQKWKQKSPLFWADPVVQTLVRGDVSRLENLGAVADATREQLVSLASNAPVPEIALAAWSRLGTTADRPVVVGDPGAAGPIAVTVVPVSPPWPTRKGELDTELLIRTRLAALLKGVRDQAAAAGPLEQVRREGPIRWRRYTEAADPDLLPASARLFHALGVNEDEVNKLSPPAHFNFFLYLANVAVAGGRDENVNAAIGNLKISSRNLKDHPEIAELIGRLDHVADPEPMTDPKLLDQKPGDTYKLAIKDSPYSVQFVRVAAPGMRPFYLATTEVSIGTFIDTVSAAGAWPAANTLLPAISPGGAGTGTTGPVRGPQAWARSANANQPIVRYPTWRYDDGRNPAQEFDFAQDFLQTRFNRHTLASDLGGNPQEEHPMQQVPARAALYAAGLLNCRLPTAREWKAAYDGFEAKTDSRQWNLRDQTFKKQLDYRTPGAPNQWPDNGVSGAFWPKDRTRPGQPNCLEGDDGTLLFRKVDARGGTTFLDLVGNVAEFVCDAPDAFDGLAEKKSADAVARFAATLVKGPEPAKEPKDRKDLGDARTAKGGKDADARGAARTDGQGKLSVIGGSALSAPELEVTRPYPVASASEPFADVGFRLAFTAPAASLAQRLKWAIEGQPYFPPPAATPVAGARAER